MPIPKEIIDNSEGNKLIRFLNSTLKDNPRTDLVRIEAKRFSLDAEKGSIQEALQERDAWIHQSKEDSVEVPEELAK